MKNLAIAALAATALSLATPAFSADATVSAEEAASTFDIAFGAAFTSQYVSRGVAQSSGPVVQGYIEPSYGIFYAGVWASGVSPAEMGTTDTAEIDVYGGIRPTFDKLSLDIGYAHYFYNNTGSCCGEAYIKATYAFTDTFSLGAEYYHDLTLNADYADATLDFSGLPWGLDFSAAIGNDFAGKTDWNAGLSKTFADVMTLDLRYHDADTQPARFVASISFDTSLSALRGK